MWSADWAGVVTRPILWPMRASAFLNRFGPAAAKSGLDLAGHPTDRARGTASRPSNSSARKSVAGVPGWFRARAFPPILKAGVTIPDPCPQTASMEPKRYMIAWNDTPGIDGDFMLVVHPTQLFFFAPGHNNPRSELCLLGGGNCPRTQYTKLVRFLEAYKGATVSSRSLESMARVHVVHAEESSNPARSDPTA